MISIAPPGVAVKRGEDPVVDGSQGGEEGGGVEDDNDNEHHREAHPGCVVLVAIVNAMSLALASTKLSCYRLKVIGTSVVSVRVSPNAVASRA